MKLFNKYSVIKQYDQVECEPASLLSVLKFYGRNTSLVDLRELNKRINSNITGDFFDHLFKLPKKFFDTRKRGNLTARIHDAMRIQ